MKKRKLLFLFLGGVAAFVLAGCGQNGGTAPVSELKEEAGIPEDEQEDAEDNEEVESAETDDVLQGEITYSMINIGDTGTDIKASIKMLTNRTDMMLDDYTGKTYKEYVEDFNKIYPNITVNIEAITDYAEDSMLRLQGGDWGDIMLIPTVDSVEFENYFVPFGTVEEMKECIRFADDKQYNGIVYGVPTTGDAFGVLYNKRIFKDAGITELPKTPEEFLKDLKLIKDNTDAIPLYTNYSAGWTMSGQWDPYISGSATGDPEYENRKLLHTSNPFSDPGDGTHAYNIFKILYEATMEGLIEDDYTTTDWEGSKGMLNRGEIGTMVLGSWAFAQMQSAGDHPEDVGYMSFPITVNGKQYASAFANYSFGINKNSSDENILASMIFVKWMTEESGFAYNEGGMPISLKETEFPEVYKSFEGIEFVSNAPPVAGEENLKATLNADSELNINNGGDARVQAIIEHASAGDMTFDEIMEEWNAAWTEAQEDNDVEILY
ncbi:MAG: ABC transporter substrate-binding protein [Lachnospiraceae bacterium]|nr:ABC transporter substrate-binding protein [Lachnospiraceae bacterium]